jgi:DNA-directed RNA polymerase subunit RPC12/RpoP
VGGMLAIVSRVPQCPHCKSKHLRLWGRGRSSRWEGMTEGRTYPKPQKPQQRNRMRAQAPAKLPRLCRRLHSFLLFLSIVASFFLPSSYSPSSRFSISNSQSYHRIVSYRILRCGKSLRVRELMTAEVTIRGASVPSITK